MRKIALLVLVTLATLTSSADDPPVIGYDIVRTFPHDASAFTQGLVFHDGALLESTGLVGSSSLRRVDLQTGRVLAITRVPAPHFAEGMTIFNGKIYQLTWQSEKGFVYDLKTLKKTGEFAYDGEGWGLTHDGKSLFLSDGSNVIRVLDPKTMRVTRVLNVNVNGRPLPRLNELEYVKGEILANVWYSKGIARIDPKTGTVTGWIDLSGLAATAGVTSRDAVLNGIAYDAASDRLFVTGKLWPKLFEIRLRPLRAA
jgi:glutamine cyclotransferase